jgi:hypothetical protein
MTVSSPGPSPAGVRERDFHIKWGSAQIRDELPIARVVAQQIAAGRDQLIDLLVGERKADWDSIEEALCLGDPRYPGSRPG